MVGIKLRPNLLSMTPSSPRKIKPISSNDWEAMVIGVQAGTGERPDPGDPLENGKWGRKYKAAAVSRDIEPRCEADPRDPLGNVFEWAPCCDNR